MAACPISSLAAFGDRPRRIAAVWQDKRGSDFSLRRGGGGYMTAGLSGVPVADSMGKGGGAPLWAQNLFSITLLFNSLIVCICDTVRRG